MQLFKLIQPLISKMSLKQLTDFKIELASKGYEVDKAVLESIAKIHGEKVIEMIKNRKLSAIHLYQ